MKQTDPQFKIRLPADLKYDIEGAAEISGRSMNAEIVHRLQKSFEDNPFSALNHTFRTEPRESVGALTLMAMNDKLQEIEELNEKVDRLQAGLDELLGREKK